MRRSQHDRILNNIRIDDFADDDPDKEKIDKLLEKKFRQGS